MYIFHVNVLLQALCVCMYVCVRGRMCACVPACIMKLTLTVLVTTIDALGYLEKG